MNFTEVMKSKVNKSLQVKNKYSLPKTNKALGLIKLADKTLLKELRDGLVELPISFIIEVDGASNEKLGNNIIAVSKILPTELVAFDFLLCDNEVSGLNKYLGKGIAPIIIKKNTLGSILKDFNPMKNEGNAFLYEKENKWSMYGAIVRYMENYRFPMDNKNLVKNVLKV